MTDDSFGYSGTTTESLSPNGHKDQPPESGITLEQYAAAKRLPVDFLQSLNLKTTNYDFQTAVRIPYPNDLGKEVYHRYRMALKAEPRFKAPPKTLGLQPIPYGLQVLADASEAGYAWLVEGESDAQVLWFIDQPAIGIPGVQAWAKFGREWAGYLQGIPMLLVPVESDSGGEQLWTLLSSTEEIRDRLCRVDITTPELKDIGALWKDAADNGTSDKLKSAIEGQVYVRARARALSSNGLGHETLRNPVRSVRAVSFTGRSRPKPREWIVDKAIPKGHATSWYGQGGVAKSFLATYLALSVASPEITEWGGQPTTTVPVVYGDFELDENEHLNRTLELVAGLGLDDVPINFNYLELTGLPSREALVIAAEECRRLGAGLFILDSVGYALAGDSEMSRDVIKFFRQEIQAIKNTGATPLLIDHQAKVVKGEKYSDKQEFGSVYKTNSVRSSFQLRGAWDANTMTATFTHKKHNLGPAIDPFSLMLTFEDGLVRVEKLGEAIPDPDKQPTARDKVLAVARELGEGTIPRFATEAEIEEKTVRNKVADLVADRELVDTGRKEGRYHIYAMAPEPKPTKGSGSGTKDTGRYLHVVEGTQEQNAVSPDPNSNKGSGPGSRTYAFVDNTKALQRVVDEISSTTAPIALDTETSSLQVHKAKVRLLQLRMPDGKSVLVDCQAVDLHPLLDALRTKHLLLHNAAYDLAVLYSYFGYEHVGPVSDTMLMFQVFYGGTSKRANLKDVLKAMLGVEVSKAEQAADWFGELTPEMLKYAATDVLHLHNLYEALKLRIEDKAPGLQPVVDLEHRMAKVTAHMSAVGMPVDETVFAECVKASREEADKKLSELDELVAVDLPDELATRNAKNKNIPETRKDKVNWDSPEQVRWAFKAVAKLDLEDTSKDTLPNVDHPMAIALLEYRKALDVYKRFRDTPVTNGRVYAKWNQLKAKTGRMSCEKPPLQGIPKPLRRAFVAPKGYKLVVSDLSQIEIRVLAVLCGDENLKADLEAGRDIHRTAAASIFGKDYDDVTADERKLAKGLVFGSMYGLGLAGFTARVNAWTGKKHTPKQVDKKFRQPLFAAYPKVQEWMDRTLSDYESGKTVTYTRLGRRRMQVSSGPEALNTPVQAGALDVMKAIAATVYERRHELKCDVEIVGLVHDEILLVVPEEKASRARDWLDNIMRSVGEEATNLGVPEEARVPVEAGTAVCDSWAEKE